jgi:hypothetical protein
MDETSQEQTEAIREICEQNLNEPGAIWEALEAKGVETTPGMIYQAFNAAEHAHSAHHALPASPDGTPGLLAEDLALLAALAKKAGGVEPLMRILSLWQETSKP